MKKVFKILSALLLVLLLTSCMDMSGLGGDGSGSDSEEDTRPRFLIQLEIECVGNLLFNKFDVDIYVNEDKIATLDHGAENIYQVELVEGLHALTFTKAGEKDVDGTINFVVSKDAVLAYKISCHKDRVEIEEIEREVETTTEALTTDSVTTEPYVETQNPFEEELKKIFPKEYAFRAAVVAFTNAYALDVFTADGNNYDISKFHSYADTSTYSMKVVSEGEWEALNATTWKGSALYLKTPSDFYITATVEVEMSGDIYIVSKIKGTMGKQGASQYTDVSDIEVSMKDPPYLKVPYSLIKDDRKVAVETVSQLSESTAKWAFEYYGEALFPYGFKCHWILDKIAFERLSDGSYYIAVGVTIENAYGNKLDAIAEGIIGGTDSEPTIIAFDVHQ